MVIDAAYHRAYYARTRERRVERKRITDAARRQRNREYVWAYLQDHPCVDCGEADIVVLQFDHLRDKVANISDMMGTLKVPLAVLQEEIEKCEVVCANCHLRRTAKQFGWAILDW